LTGRIDSDYHLTTPNAIDYHLHYEHSTEAFNFFQLKNYTMKTTLNTFAKSLSISLVLLSLCAASSADTPATAVVTTAPAAEKNEVTIRIKDHQFIPAQTKVAAGQRIKLIIKNEDSTAEEFESHSLSREKIVQGNNQIVVLVGPLKKGTYQFGGEYHEKTAQGSLIAE
jgi:plastocyanin